MKLMPWRSKEKNAPHEVSSLPRWGDVERQFERFFTNPWAALNGTGEFFGAAAWNPPVDITESDHEILVRSEIPGVQPEDLSITVSGDLLTLAGEKSESIEKKGENCFHSERRFGSFRRSVQLPSSVDSEHVKAEYENGVLTVTLKRREGAAVKRIPVSSKR